MKDDVVALTPYKKVKLNPEDIDTFTVAVDLNCIICPTEYPNGIVRVCPTVVPENTTNNVGFTDKDNVADAEYVMYVVPVVAVIQLVPEPVDDKICPAVPTSPDVSVKVDFIDRFPLKTLDPNQLLLLLNKVVPALSVDCIYE